MPKAKAKPTTTLVIREFDLRSTLITLIGDAPLICHAWSKKAKQEMLAKQMKEVKQGKDAKDPHRDFEESLYHMPTGGYGFPSIGFKSAAIDACSFVEGITKVEARGAFHIPGELVKINSEIGPIMRDDMVRVGMGVADIRFRGEFRDWSVEFPVRYNAGVLSAEQIVNLFQIAGFSIGVGEWRPQKDGMFGLFHVKSSYEK